jgi:glutaredoxin-related protein
MGLIQLSPQKNALTFYWEKLCSERAKEVTSRQKAIIDVEIRGDLETGKNLKKIVNQRDLLLWRIRGRSSLLSL